METIAAALRRMATGELLPHGDEAVALALKVDADAVVEELQEWWGVAPRKQEDGCGHDY